MAVIALAASGCVKDKPSEPGVRAITTDLKYKELQKKNAAPPNTVPAPIKRDAPSTLPPLSGSEVGPVAPNPLDCPTPPPTETADENAGIRITKLPVEGEYLWRVEGSQKYQDIRLALPRFTKRAIENVEGQISGDTADFTFETVEKQLSAIGGGATVRSFFDVTSTTATDNTVRPGAGVSSGRTSTAGVRLTRLEVLSPDGTESNFIPSQPVRYLITPVLTGPERFWMDQVTDVSGSEVNQSLVHRAHVTGRMTVVACGERYRAWRVIAEQTYTREGTSVTRHFEYGVATHMGGILIFEHIESPCTRNNNKCDEGDPADLVVDASYGKRLESD